MLSILITAIYCISFVAGQWVRREQYCPSSQWSKCEEQGLYDYQICKIPVEVKSGFIAMTSQPYGVVSGHLWRMVPFSRTVIDGDATSHVVCPVFAYCCFIEMDNEFDDDYSGSIAYESFYDFTDPASNGNPVGVRADTYWDGAVGVSIYRVVQNSKIVCDEGQFPEIESLPYLPPTNDPELTSCSYGISDSVQSRIPSSLNTTWTRYNEGEWIPVDTNTAYWIRMGAISQTYGDQFYYQFIFPQTDHVYCELPLFDADELSPAPNAEALHCYLSEPVYIFANKVGEWQQLFRCDGCDSSEYKLTKGVSIDSSSSIEKTKGWTTSLSNSYSAGIDIQGVSGGASISMTQQQSASVTTTMSSDITRTEEISETHNCDYSGFWQWIVDTDQIDFMNAPDALSFTVQSSNYVCGPCVPRCPPSFCNDTNHCQTCLGGFEPIPTYLPCQLSSVYNLSTISQQIIE